jgi:hypothetical protein
LQEGFARNYTLHEKVLGKRKGRQTEPFDAGFGRSGVNGGKGTAFTWNWEQMMLPYEFSTSVRIN